MLTFEKHTPMHTYTKAVHDWILHCHHLFPLQSKELINFTEITLFLIHISPIKWDVVSGDWLLQSEVIVGEFPWRLLFHSALFLFLRSPQAQGGPYISRSPVCVTSARCGRPRPCRYPARCVSAGRSEAASSAGACGKRPSENARAAHRLSALIFRIARSVKWPPRLPQVGATRLWGLKWISSALHSKIHWDIGMKGTI